MNRRRVIQLAIACVAVSALVTMAVVFARRTGPITQPSGRDVPLGVEGAVIIRSAGPRLVARPYRRGASVNVRIAEEVQQGSTRVYDVRYVVTLPGEFDLMEYLTSAEGVARDDLPPFKVNGQTRLTRDIETRIREIEDVEVRIWHWYYETLAALAVFWVLWLLALILIGRRKAPPRTPPPPPEPSLAEQIAGYLAALGRGELSVADKARLEILLLRHWRERLSPQPEGMAVACRRMQQEANLGPAYRSLEAWLHNPAAAVDPVEIVERCDPFARL